MTTGIYSGGPGPRETPAVAAAGETAERAGAIAAQTGGWIRYRLGVGWRFTRHLLEMGVAMLAGMIVLGVALEGLGEPPGYANLLVRDRSGERRAGTECRSRWP